MAILGVWRKHGSPEFRGKFGETPVLRARPREVRTMLWGFAEKSAKLTIV
jgi:hypothetical protein